MRFSVSQPLIAVWGAIILTVAAAVAAPVAAPTPSPRGEPPELAYLKQVNAWRAPTDPELLLLLMAQFANTGRFDEGIETFRAMLERFGPQLDDKGRAMVLAAQAMLRASHANDVHLLRRIGWTRETLAMLDEAKRLTGGDMFVARWMSGVVRAQVPAFFGEREAARIDLEWCEAHAQRAPHSGWLREVFFQLAAVHRARGDAALAATYQTRSGLPAGSKPAVFTSPFAEDAVGGHLFSGRSVHEVIPGTIFVLSGFEFTEYAFVVSADRRELIAIDAGTRPDAARAALQALRERMPSLPPLTTVLVTHAHWDHVGGHRAFRELAPGVQFVGRANFADELAHDAVANPAMLRRFFGRDFDLADVLSYRPDVTIDRPTELVLGGTRFSLLPARGGETDDAMVVNLPEYGVAFIGDVFMPYLGAPFTEEGSLEGFLAAIDQLHALAPRRLLSGHQPLTRIFSSTAMLDELRPALVWLRDAVGEAMRGGAERGTIHATNLIAPTLQSSRPDVQLAYLVLRENVINRLFDQQSGYWRNGLHGLDTLTDADRGDTLVTYLGLSGDAIAAAAERMVADGRHELAAELIRWATPRVGPHERIETVRRVAYLKLMEKYQEFNPFKFIVYAGEIGMHAPRIDLPEAPAVPADVTAVRVMH